MLAGACARVGGTYIGIQGANEEESSIKGVGRRGGGGDVGSGGTRGEEVRKEASFASSVRTQRNRRPESGRQTINVASLCASGDH